MKEAAIWLSEEAVTSLVSLGDTISALEDSVRQLGHGSAFNIPKALGSYSDASSMHSLGSAMV
ncbi:hypothetical protein QMO17_37250, partial [Klebsiella pneumoniae]|nr:hypothetical protein [Klebsiella pneumoniae]